MNAAIILSVLLALAPTDHWRDKVEFRFHSHNDYRHEVPFYQAYSQGASCIECDMHYMGNGRFLVGHDREDLDPGDTFEKLYLEPLASVFRTNGGVAWTKAPDKRLILMVEIKSQDPDAYADALQKKLRSYRDVFDPSRNPDACGLLIGGWRLPSDFTKYPSWFMFDVQYNSCDPASISAEQLERIGMFSMNFSLLSKWKGKGQFQAGERENVQAVIDAVHAMGKPVRFWGAPDNPTAWGTLNAMGADFINTDKPEECAAYAASLRKPSDVMMFGDDSKTGRPMCKDPHVVWFDGRYLLYYSMPPKMGSDQQVAGWNIGIAQSTDLVHWTKAGEIEPQPGLDYEAKGFCAPCARVVDGKVHLFCQSYGSGAKDAVLHSVSDDGINFVRDSSNPIFAPKPSWWTCGRAIDAEVISFKGKWFLYFATRNPEFRLQLPGVAEASAATDFSRTEWTLCTDAPILKPELPWEQECIEGCSVIERYGKLYMFYAGAFNNCPQQIGVAVSDDGVRWTRLWEEPFLTNGPEGSWNSSESGHPHIFDAPDGRTYLFFQGNNTGGKTWFISQNEVIWVDGIPYLARRR